jgi:hypothetical protein
MHAHSQWHHVYEQSLLKQSPPVQDIADFFMQSPLPDIVASPESQSSGRDVSPAFNTTLIVFV